MPQKSVERLLIWFVPISLVGFVAGAFAFLLHDRETLVAAASALGWPPLQFGAYLKLSQSLIFAAGNFAVAMWLAFRPHASIGRRMLWSLFGLVSGLWALAIWLLLQLFAIRAAADS